jgi:hypothetical protein
LLANQNRVAEAERAYRRALAIWEAAPGGPKSGWRPPARRS